MRCKWGVGTSAIGIPIRNGNWLRKSFKVCLQELPSKCLLREESCETGEGWVFPSLVVLWTSGPGTKATSEEAFICCLVQGIIWEALVLHIFGRDALYISAKGISMLVSNTVRLKSESSWNEEQFVSSSEAFYEAQRPSLSVDIGQLQVSKICLIYKENIEYGKKRDFKNKNHLGIFIWSYPMYAFFLVMPESSSSCLIELHIKENHPVFI